MGLDMHWFVEPTAEEKAKALLLGEMADKKEIGYFRKYYELNDHMGLLYAAKGIEDFNTVDLIIDQEGLNHMRSFVITPDSNQVYAKEYKELCDTIQDYINQGRTVVYWPWW